MRFFGPIVALVLFTSCVGLAQIGDKEEITFRSGPFKIVGDLQLPEGDAPFPVILFVHGDGPNNRTSGVTYPPIMARMHRAGYATFAWDKPGTGESTGEIDRSRLGEQRAQIVLDAIAAVKQRPEIDPERIGMWGISQAGYVMPRVLAESNDIAFMIAVSCPSTPGVEQGIYLLTAQMLCAGYPKEKAKQLEQEIRAFTMARTYDEYVRYKTPLVATPAFESLAQFGQRIDVTPEDHWHPADPQREYYAYDPMETVGRTTIPILAFFGGKDTQVDPVRGSQTYREVLARAGNPHSRVELIPGTDHNIIVSQTGCIKERRKRSRSGWTRYAPEYLDILEEWLGELRRQTSPPQTH